MNTNTTILTICIFSALLFAGCSKETVEPNLTGSIEGQVQNSSTGQPLAAVSISTNPGTDAILTGPDGMFSIAEVPTGNYNVQAQKEDFESRSVRVNVKEDRTAQAQILLSSDDQSSSNDIRVDISSFNNTSSNDSSFVDVDYRVENIGDQSSIPKYEIVFQIYTPGPSFFQEVQGDSLGSGELDVGSFTKYIRQQNADSVVVSNIFAPNSGN